jgi:multiple sugar transport system permease protein
MTQKRRVALKSGVSEALRAVVLAMVLALVLFPLIWIFLTSLKGKTEIYVFPVRYWPNSPTAANYMELFGISSFGTYFTNSLIVSMVGAGGAMLCAIMGAYVLARFTFRGKGAILFAFLFTQMVPMFIILAPLYTIMSQLGLINHPASLMICYTVMNIPYCTVTLRGFFQRIPGSLEEAAQIDGCNRIQSLVRIVMPVMASGIAATFMFVFVQCWNEVFLAIMFIDVEAYKTIPVALNSFIMKYDINWGSLAAGIVISILPTILMFAFVQKYIAGGLTAGAVKG